MNIIKFGAALAATMALVACNSSTGTATTGTTGSTTGGGGTTAPVTIFDLALPADFDRDALPQSAQDAFDEFNRRNELDVATGGPSPSASGNFLFFGTDGLGLAVAEDDGSYSFVQGDVFLEGNVNTAQIGGQFQALSITDADGNTTELQGQVVSIDTGAIIDGRFTNTLSTGPSFNVSGESASVTGTSQGAFVGDGSEILGIANGTVTVGSDPAQSFSGGYIADEL